MHVFSPLSLKKKKAKKRPRVYLQLRKRRNLLWFKGQSSCVVLLYLYCVYIVYT